MGIASKPGIYENAVGIDLPLLGQSVGFKAVVAAVDYIGPSLTPLVKLLRVFRHLLSSGP